VSAVFSHGRLRLYLLKLLAEGPRHGYELIRLLESRFLGLYTPSAGTIYPRLQRLEAEGRVTHAAAGGRKVYEITEAGRTELRQRAGELADLEREVAVLTSLASEIEQQVSGSVRDSKRELREAARESRGTGRPRPWRTRAPSVDVAADLERAVSELAAEVRRLGRTAGVGEPELVAARVVVTRALGELRSLLPG
jgi:DNA-binding PadR family transcriptional regulator